jgi:hypothetical protein
MGITSGSKAIPLDGFTLHIFTSSGIFTPQFTGSVEILNVAGGGGGGMDMGGGGGGGGVLTSTTFAVTSGTPVTVTVGAGGAGAPGGGESGQNTAHQFTIAATNGGNSVIGALTAIGGGKGGSSYFGYTPDNGYGATGGSGGGASGYSDGNTGRAGTGTAGQGNNGGGSVGQYYAGGGGGAGAAGGSGTGANAAVGGAGILNSILGVDYYWAAGGGGGSYSNTGGSGGIGGGGSSGTTNAAGGAGFNPGGTGGNGGTGVQASRPGGNGGINTGGGGGGGSHYNSNNRGGNGGSGVVIIKYPSVLSSTSTGGIKIFRNEIAMKLDAGNPKSYSGSGTTFTDISSKGKNGTLTNSPTYDATNRGRFLFDGIAQYVASSFATTSGQAVTYMGWLYSTETGTTYRNFVDSVTANPMIWWNTSGQIEFDTASNYTTTAVYRNQWVHVALSKPAGSSAASYYVNGSLAGTGTAYTTPAVTPTWFYRGATSTLWKGYCSNYQAYNRALSAAEIKQSFNALRGRFGI